MAYTAKLKCREPRDKIYALLGLTQTRGLQPDYARSESEVFMNLAQWCLNKFEDLRVLSYAQGISKTICNLPSWAPSSDFTKLGLSLTDIKHFRASGHNSVLGTKPTWDIFRGGELRLDGFYADAINEMVRMPLVRGSTTEDIAIWNASNSDYREALLQCTELAGVMNDEGSAQSQLFYKALTFELQNSMSRGSVEYFKTFETFVRSAVRKVKEPDWEASLDRGDLSSPCVIARWAYNRWFGITQKGHFLWAPTTSKPRDQIYILRGARVPFVVRQNVSGNFQIVGECWIQGLMEGEALELPGFNWETITFE
jgi:hypothetical protein